MFASEHCPLLVMGTKHPSLCAGCAVRLTAEGQQTLQSPAAGMRWPELTFSHSASVPREAIAAIKPCLLSLHRPSNYIREAVEREKKKSPVKQKAFLSND